MNLFLQPKSFDRLAVPPQKWTIPRCAKWRSTRPGGRRCWMCWVPANTPPTNGCRRWRLQLIVAQFLYEFSKNFVEDRGNLRIFTFFYKLKAVENDWMTLDCSNQDGLPLIWRKDFEELNASRILGWEDGKDMQRRIITAGGMLLIRSARTKDAGLYSWVCLIRTFFDKILI